MSRSWLRKGVLVAVVSVFVALAALPAVQAQQPFARGAVVALQGTPHLWIADDQGVLHWGGDTRALEGKHINWSDRTEVSLEQIRTLPVGDPWLSACGLLKDGNPIYLVKWETEWPRPQLFHIQSIGDVELFGINASNYGRFVVSVETCDEWAQPHGFAMADLQRDVLPTAVPTPTLKAYRSGRTDLGAANSYIYVHNRTSGVWSRATDTDPQQGVVTVAADAGGRWFGQHGYIDTPALEAYLRVDNPPTGINGNILDHGIDSHPSSQPGAAPREDLCRLARAGTVYPLNVHAAALLELFGCLG